MQSEKSEDQPGATEKKPFGRNQKIGLWITAGAQGLFTVDRAVGQLVASWEGPTFEEFASSTEMVMLTALLGILGLGASIKIVPKAAEALARLLPRRDKT